jgi:S1-C subfamily serine protease
VTVFHKSIPKEQPGAPATREPVIDSFGSGVVITRNAKTWILTNQHVVEHADALSVITHDGVEHVVEFVDSVPQYDIALLRFTEKSVPVAKPVAVRGRASVDLDEGEWCFATGNPFGLAVDGIPVATFGVVSGKDRVLASNFTYGRAIQHDAAVNPGNSGGPLWNLKGDFVGINGMIITHDLAAGQGASNSGASYAIPVEQIEAFLGSLVDAKKDAKAGFLGLLTETRTDKAGRPEGAVVTKIDPRSPAAAAKGLRVGDLVVGLSYNAQPHPIRTSTDLTNELSLCSAGIRVIVTYKRDGRESTWSGALGSQ